MKPLDHEERELLESYERDKWQSVADTKSRAERFREYAKGTLRKDKPAADKSTEKGE